MSERRERKSGLGYYTYWDKRKPNGCIYCGKPADTREHVPSKCILADPYPDDLPTIPACYDCNQNFSLDEEYFICYLEVLKSKYYSNYIISDKVKRLLKESQNLQALINTQIIKKGDRLCLEFETSRIEKILKKIATGQAGYDYDSIYFDGASGIWYDFLPNISTEKKKDFENIKRLNVIPEISSRFSSSACIVQSSNEEKACAFSGWNCIQEHRYSYNVFLNDSDGVSVKMIFLDFLYCQVDFNK